MLDPHTLHLISHIKTMIMRQATWDEEAPLSDDQAVELSSKIGAKTRNSVNSGELLKFWNDIPEKVSDHTHILDALAQFQEYQSWEEYVSTHQMPLGGGKNALSLGATNPTPNPGEETLDILKKKNNQLRTLAWVLGVVNLLLLAFLLYRMFGMEG